MSNYDDDKVKALVAMCLHNFARLNFSHVEAFAFAEYMRVHAVGAVANHRIDKAIEAGEQEAQKAQKISDEKVKGVSHYG